MDLSALAVNSVGHFARMPQVRTARTRPADWLVVWATAGGISGTLGGEAFDCPAGSLVVMPPGVAQDYRSPRSRSWEWLFAHADGLGGLAARLGATPVARVGGGDGSIRRRWVDLVATHLDEPDLAPARLAGILADLAGSIGHDAGEFAAVRRFVQEHLDRPLTAAELAEVAGMSVPHFNRRFRATLGTSPMRYVARQRVERARVLLRDTPQKLAAVAAAVGFADPFHFSRVYKQHTGRPPSTDRAS